MNAMPIFTQYLTVDMDCLSTSQPGSSERASSLACRISLLMLLATAITDLGSSKKSQADLSRATSENGKFGSRGRDMRTPTATHRRHLDHSLNCILEYRRRNLQAPYVLLGAQPRIGHAP